MPEPAVLIDGQYSSRPEMTFSQRLDQTPKEDLREYAEWHLIPYSDLDDEFALRQKILKWWAEGSKGERK